MKGKSVGEDKQIAASQLIKEKEYWMNKLSGELVSNCFAYDFQAKDGAEQTLKSISFKLSGEVLSLLEKLTKDSNYKLHIILTAVLVVLLYKYTGSEDVIIGTTIDKQEIETEFINTVLVLRNRLHERMTFKELVLQTRQTIGEAIEHQNYPIEALVNRLITNTGQSGLPLFDTALLLENIHDRNYLQQVKPNMIFSFLRTGEGIDGTVEYNFRLYERHTVERIVRHFSFLLQQVLANPDQLLSCLSLLTVEEEGQLLFDFNDTSSGYPGDKTIHALFEEQVDRTPDNIAVVGPLEVKYRTYMTHMTYISYRELNERSRQLANLLMTKGVQPDTIVGIMMARSLELVIGILGILKAGGAYLPIDVEYPEERINYMLKDSDSKILVTGQGLLSKELKFEKAIIYLPDAINRVPAPHLLSFHTSTLPPLYPSQHSNLAYVIYTSGSTGKPKGVMVDHRSLVNYIWWAAKTYVKDEAVNFPLYTSIAFDLTITSIFTPLLTGQAVIVYGDKGVNKKILIEEVIGHLNVGVVKLTPSHLKLIKDKEIPSSHPIKRLIVGGEDLNTQLARNIDSNFAGKIGIYNEYGPTEATVGCMTYQFNPREDNRGSVPIGIPADNTKICVLDSHQRPVPIGVAGELYISGEGLARGYLNSPELTAEKFVNNSFWEGVRMYRTGDLAVWLSDRTIEFSGRIDHQVKIRGYRVDTEEIETQLLSHEDIKESAVTARDHHDGSKYLCAYVVSEKNIEDTELREYLSRTLPGYMVPADFIFLKQLPITSNGKLDRKKLPEPGVKSKGKRKGAGSHIPPRTKIEEKLVEIWSRVLGVDKDTISIAESFFELGGHSLNAASVIAQIHKELNVNIPLIELFRTSTIEGLSKYITTGPLDRFFRIEKTESREYYALSSAQKRVYIMQQLNLKSVGYNIPEMYILEGSLNRDRLEKVSKKLIKRHESFRTSFEMIGNEPVQRIHAPSTVVFKIGYHEASDQGVENIINAFIRPFELTQPPLVRVGLIKTGKQKFILMLDIHHIVSDGVSLGILVNDFLALSGGKELPLLDLQYKDFSLWQNQKLDSGELKKQEKYWLNRFKGKIPILELPTDYPRPPVQRFEGHTIRGEIDEILTGKLKEIASQQEVTFYMITLAIYLILLSKYTGQNDIIVGTPVAGRRHPDLEQIVGMFINVLLMRNTIEGKKSFEKFLEDVKYNTLQAFDNQDYPFDYLAARLNVKSEANRNPLYEVVFALQNLGNQEFKIPGMKLGSYGYAHRTIKTDLRLGVEERDNKIQMLLTYSTALFKQKTGENMLRHYKEILKQVVTDKTIQLEDIDISLDLAMLKPDDLRSDENEFKF